MREFIYLLGKNIGALSGAAVALLWIAAMWDPTMDWNNAGVSLGIAFLMSVVAIVVVLASWRGHGIFVIILFLLSFYPIGYYLWTVPHWIRWIGAFNIGFLIAGLMVWLAKPYPEDDESETHPGE
jgi:hypothetical protein